MVYYMATTAQRSNLEIAKSAYEAFNTGDMDTVLSTFDDDIEWIEPAGARYPGTVRGSQAVVEDVFSPLMAEYETFEVKPERFIDAGDTIVVLGSNTGTARETGKDATATFAHVLEMKDGKLVRCTDYRDTAIEQRAFEP